MSELSSKEDKYGRYGFQSAQNSNSKPEAIEGFLDKVYERFLDEHKLDEKGIQEKIGHLKSEIQLEKEKKNDKNAALATLKSNKEDKEKEIEELELEKIEIKGGNGETEDTIPFVIGAFITILLTLYLFVFYSSSGYSAFYGIEEDQTGILNPDVFADAMNEGGGVMALIIFFPIIFLGLGFLIHDSIEKNKKRVSENKPTSYTTILLLLLVTLITDAFIGYRIAKGLFINEHRNYAITPEWSLSMFYSDPNFYLILLLGFVVYVIWGFLLNFVLSHPYLKTENEKVKLLVENINRKIGDKRKELAEIAARIFKIENDIATHDNKIIEKEQDVIDYQTGVIPVNIPALKGSIGEFFAGWQYFTYGNFDKMEANARIDSTIKIREQWINNKIDTLKSEK